MVPSYLLSSSNIPFYNLCFIIVLRISLNLAIYLSTMLELKTQSAIIMRSAGEAYVEHKLSIPSPDAAQLLIKVHAVALNPSDWMALDMLGRPGAGLGYDFSGEVVEIGEAIQVSWKVGDRVAGFVHGCKICRVTLLWQ